MAVRQTSMFCGECKKPTLHVKHVFSGGMGCLLTILTGGLFLIIWVLADMAGIISPYRCQSCGRARYGCASSFLGLATVVAMVLVATHFISNRTIHEEPSVTHQLPRTSATIPSQSTHVTPALTLASVSPKPTSAPGTASTHQLPRTSATIPSQTTHVTPTLTLASVTPKPTSAPGTASDAQGVDDLEIKLHAAQVEAEKAQSAYATAKVAMLEGDTDYQAAKAKAAEMDREREKARTNGSTDLPSISTQWMTAKSEAAKAEAAALNAPALRALGYEVSRTQKVVEYFQGKIAERTRLAADAAKAAAAEERASRPITYEQFRQIEDGMSYNEVYRILGRHGKEISRVSLGDTTTVMLIWENPEFSNMNAMFQNDKLVSKAQFGLK